MIPIPTDEARSGTAVVLLNYNNAGETIEMIETLRDLKPAGFCRIIVVDNASTDDSADTLERFMNGAADCELIRADRNGGYAYGNNLGIRRAREAGCRYSWVINSDIAFPDPDVLDKLMYMFSVDDSVACVSPRVVGADGAEVNRELYRPSVWDLTLGQFTYRRKGRQTPKAVLEEGRYCPSYRPQGCCMLVDNEKLNQIGDMDEQTFLYAEEPILAERLSRKDFGCACCLDTRIVHYGGNTVRRNHSGLKKYLLRKKSLNYYYKNYRGWCAPQIALCNTFHFLKWIILKK